MSVQKKNSPKDLSFLHIHCFFKLASCYEESGFLDKIYYFKYHQSYKVLNYSLLSYSKILMNNLTKKKLLIRDGQQIDH